VNEQRNGLVKALQLVLSRKIKTIRDEHLGGKKVVLSFSPTNNGVSLTFQSVRSKKLQQKVA